MSKETKAKKTRSTKKVSGEESPHTAELEAKIAELEAKLANLSSQVKPSEARPSTTAEAQPKAQRGTLPAGMKPTPPPAPKEAPKPAPAPEPARPRPTASGPTHGTLPAGMKPTPPPAPKEEPRYQASAPEVGEVAPAYAQISSSGYTGNKYYATRPRLSYHAPNKQFKGEHVTTQTTTAPPPPPAPAPKPQRGTLPAGMKQTVSPPAPEPHAQRGTLPAGTKEPEKKSMWRSKGADYENYVSEETHKAPPPPPPAPEPARPRPTASGPTHGTLPAGMKPTPPPAPKEEPRYQASAPEVGEVAPAYAQISSSGYTGNKYYATRPRLSYHAPNKQFKGEHVTTQTTTAPPPPPKPKSTFRTTLPAGFKP